MRKCGWVVRTSIAAGALFGSISAAAQVSGLSGTLIVTNKGPSTATIIDVASGRALATLPTGQGPHEIVVSRDGNVAVVTDYGSRSGGNTLTVIDVPGLKVVRTINEDMHIGTTCFQIMRAWEAPCRRIAAM